MNKQDNIKVPRYKEKLKTYFISQTYRKMEKKIIVYKSISVAASILFMLSVLMIFWSDINVFTNDKFSHQTLESYTSQIENDSKMEDKLETIIMNETIREGKQVYPIKQENIMVKKIILNTGKTIKLKKSFDMGSYADAY